MAPSSPSADDERALLEAARFRAERLLRSIQTDLDALPPESEGHRLYLAVFDAAERTLNNLDRLLNQPGGALRNGRGVDPT